MWSSWTRINFGNICSARDLTPKSYSRSEANAVVGLALFFHNYSTFSGRPGIYIEDLFVLPKFRGHGHGKALLAALARLAIDRSCGRLEWVVLDWNKPAIDFCESFGCCPD